MLYNSGLIDKVILFLGCLVIYLCQPDMPVNVVPVLIIIIYTCLLSYIENDRIVVSINIGFIALCFYMPGLIFFIPLAGYDMLFSKYQYWNLLILIPMINFLQNTSIISKASAVGTLAVSLLLKYRTKALGSLQLKYNNLNDTAKEMSMQLKKQNSELLERQDNEVYLATINERNRIAREIHDSVGHLLSSAILQLGALLTINRDEGIKDNLDNLKDTLTQAMNSIRSSVHNLYDESIDLKTQIESLTDNFKFCEITFDYQFISNPGKNLKYAIIFIVKEAMSNIMKHSTATKASITFREHPAIYQIVIEDNGEVKSYSTENGMGIKNMADRVESFKGNINISINNGFKIFISIPKEAN